MPGEQKRTTRRGFITTTTSAGMALYLAACGGSELQFQLQLERRRQQRPGGELQGTVTLNNLFQQQAGYSASDLAGMTKLFEQANPHIKVNNTLVAYEALHDKIVAAAPAGTYDVVLGDCIWPAEFGSKGIVKDISLRRQRRCPPARSSPARSSWPTTRASTTGCRGSWTPSTCTPTGRCSRRRASRRPR